jgi:hypothetical protein
MLPFFRKIRYRLAKDNQFFKYSRYAIGEIVLVVVGILIALQINNWNEERKIRKELSGNLIKLRNELKFNLNSLENMNSFLLLGDNSAILVSRFLNSELTKIDTVELANSLSLAATFAIFRPTEAAYQSLVTSGNMELIENDSLLSIIGEIYNKDDWGQTIIKTSIIGSYQDYLDRLHYHSTSPFVRSRIQRILGQLYVNDGKKVPYLGMDLTNAQVSVQEYFDWDAMVQDAELNAYVNQVMTYRVMQLHIHRLYEMNMNKALAEIEIELAKTLF